MSILISTSPPSKKVSLGISIPIPGQFVRRGQVFKVVPYRLTPIHVIARSSALTLTACNKYYVEYRPVAISSYIRAEAGLQDHIDPQLFFGFTDSSLLGRFININESTRKRQFTFVGLDAANTEEHFTIIYDIHDGTNGRIDPVLMASLANEKAIAFLSSNPAALYAISSMQAVYRSAREDLNPDYRYKMRAKIKGLKN